MDVDATLDDVFVEFHVGDAVHEEATDTIVAFIDGDIVPRFVELGRTG